MNHQSEKLVWSLWIRPQTLNIQFYTEMAYSKLYTLGTGSFFPLAWKALIDEDLISYSQIMWIWFGFSIFSLVLGTLIYPWHNLPQDLTKGRICSF